MLFGMRFVYLADMNLKFYGIGAETPKYIRHYFFPALLIRLHLKLLVPIPVCDLIKEPCRTSINPIPDRKHLGEVNAPFWLASCPFVVLLLFLSTQWIESVMTLFRRRGKE